MVNNMIDRLVPEINVPILEPINEIIINGKSFRIHPVYDLYGSSEDGFITHVVKRNTRRGTVNSRGYFRFSVGMGKSCSVPRFIWECYHGVINDGRVINHINNNKNDNRLCNLQLITQQQNCEKAAKNRDYSFSKKNYENRKCVRAINCNDNTESFYNSLYAVNQHLGINAGIVKMVCEGLNRCKSGISKVDGCRYKFNYIRRGELPEDHKRSANIRPKRKKKDKQE
jgi:hypothetical protein